MTETTPSESQVFGVADTPRAVLVDAAEAPGFDPRTIIAAAHRLWVAEDRDTATVMLRNLSRVRPGDPAVISSLVSALLNTGHPVLAAKAAKRLVVSDPAVPVANRLRLTVPGSSNEDLRRQAARLTMLATSDWGDWLAAGLMLGKAGDAEAAVGALRRAERLAPTDDTRRPLAKALLDAGRAAEAVAVLAKLDHFDAGTFDLFLTHATALGAFAQMEAVIERHGPALPGSESRAALAQVHIWRYRDHPDQERDALEIAARDLSLADRLPIEHLTWAVRSGSEDDIARTFAATVPWRPATDPLPKAEQVTDIHTLDPFDGHNISVDLAFASFLAKDRGRITGARLWVHERACRLFARAFPEFDVRAYPAPPPLLTLGETDLHARELPLALPKDQAEGPPAPFLSPDPDLKAAAKARFAESGGGRPTVGICWRSSAISPDDPDAARSDIVPSALPLDTYLADGRRFWRKCVALPFFEGLLADRSFSVASMQYGLERWEAEGLAEHPVFGAMTIPEIDHFGDLDAVAAEIAALDALVTIPCGYAHLAAALGVPTYVLLNDTPVIYWVWQARAGLYPGVRLFTKEAEWQDGNMVSRKYAGDWRPTVDAAHKALRDDLL